MDIIIRNGTLATAEGVYDADIGIEGERIVQIGGEMPRARSVIDASGCFVMPGGIDVHTHLDTQMYEFRTADNWDTGTVAAACGGTTTIIDFCAQAKGETLAQAVANWDERSRGRASIDYGYHMIITDMSESVFAELAGLPDKGITSFKLFMAYKGREMVDDLTLMRAMEQANKSGAIVMVHAENGDAVVFLQEKYLAEGKTAPKYHAETRPPRVEAEATGRAVALAELTGASLYVVHLTCEEALKEVVRGKMRGVDVLAETCTQYLYTTKDDLDRPGFGGAKFVFSPAARTKNDQEVLWGALRGGLLETVSSDHCVTNFKDQKERGRDDFTRIPNGGPGIEERLMMLYQGVNEGRLGITQFVDLVATRPAKVFGLYPRKGVLAAGADADVLIWDPEAKLTITNAELHHAVDYTNYTGRTVRGLPRTVLSRGSVIVENRQFVGERGRGRFIKRARYSRLRAQPQFAEAAE